MYLLFQQNRNFEFELTKMDGSNIAVGNKSQKEENWQHLKQENYNKSIIGKDKICFSGNSSSF